MTARKMKDGDRFGSWTIIKAYPPNEQVGYARVRCDCGLASLRFRAAIQAGKSSKCLTCAAKERNRVYRKTSNGVWKVIHRGVGKRNTYKGPRNTYECLTCAFQVEASSWLVRCTRCHPRPLSKVHQKRTGISHEGIRLRLLSGWTLEDATTRKRGDVPNYVRVSRPHGRNK